LWSSEEKSLQASNLNFFIIASQNGPARQTDESYSSQRFCIPFSKAGFTG
jgi:hypothetical protein